MAQFELFTHTKTMDLATYVLLPYTRTEDITQTSYVQARMVAPRLMCIDDLNSVNERSGVGTVLLHATVCWGIEMGARSITGSVVTRDGFYKSLVQWYDKRGLSVQNGWLVGETNIVRARLDRVISKRDLHYDIISNR